MRWFLLFLVVFVVSFVGAVPHGQYPSFSAVEPGFVVVNHSLSVVDDVVFKTGWYSVGGGSWQSFSLSGASYGGSDDWLAGFGTASLPVFGVGEHYVIVYSCSLLNDAFDCHGDKWQLSIFNEGVVAAVNLGGPEYLSSAGVLYEADALAMSPHPYVVSQYSVDSYDWSAIAGTDDDVIYESVRVGRDYEDKPLQLEIPVPDGDYDVTFHFSEIYFGTSRHPATKELVFDIYLEGMLVEKDFFMSDYPVLTAIDKTYSVTVSDGLLDIDFVTDTGLTVAGVVVKEGLPVQHECNTAVDCDDGDASTEDTCSGWPRTCSYQALPTCTSCGETSVCSNGEVCYTTPSECGPLLGHGESDCDCDANCAQGLVCMIGVSDGCCVPDETWDGTSCHPAPVVYDCNGYFISNDGDDSNSGMSASSPWRTLSKLGSVTLGPGDEVCLRRGDMFYGAVQLSNVVGSVSEPIRFASYGAGDAPVISGLSTLSEKWIPYDENIWMLHDSSFSSAIDHVVVDGVDGVMGRYPKDSTWTPSENTLDSGKTYLVDENNIVGYPDGYWNDAEVVIGSRNWVLDVVRVSSQVGGRLNFRSSTTYEVSSGDAYFLQNHPRTLTRDGEWAYLDTDKTLYLYSLTNPNDKVVQVSTRDTLVSFSDVSHVLMEDINLSHANENTVFFDDSDDVTLRNMFISHSGRNAISGSCTHFGLFDSVITDAFNNGLYMGYSSGTRVIDNTFLRTGAVAGRGASGNGAYVGVQMSSSDNVVIQYNRLEGVGYNGIGWTRGNDVLVDSNFVEGACMTKFDCGAIYTWASSYSWPTSSSHEFSNLTITNNIVLNGQGTGIYLDGGSNHVLVQGNTVYNRWSPYHSNDQWEVVFNDNLFVHSNVDTDPAIAQITVGVTQAPLSNVGFYNNRFVTMTADNSNLHCRNPVGHSTGGDDEPAYCTEFALMIFDRYDDWMMAHTTFEGNYLVNGFHDYLVKVTRYPGGTKTNYAYSFNEWEALGSNIRNNHPRPFSFAESGLSNSDDYVFFDYNAEKTSKTISLPSGFQYFDLDGGEVSGSVTLQPYSSVLFLRKAY